jgi:peptidoglycan-associated lipoprotein
MKKCISLSLLLALMMGMVFFASCAKKNKDVADPMEIQMAAERARAEAELERQRRIAEEDIQGSRLTEDAEAERIREGTERTRFLNAKIYFDFDNSSLSEEARVILLDQARWLKQNKDASIVVEGHCDNRGTEEYNLALGSRRAQSVKDFLVHAGVEPSRIVTVSYGEERPAVRGNNEDAWSKNRRAEFRLR